MIHHFCRNNRGLSLWMLAAMLVLQGCGGYHLRQMPSLPFSELVFLDNHLPDKKAFSTAMQNQWKLLLTQELSPIQYIEIESSNAHKGKWYLDVLMDSEQRQIASLASDGTVREYRLYKHIKVQLKRSKKEENTPFEPITIETSRDLPYKELQRTAKELEEQKLWADMNAEIAQRLGRQIVWQLENDATKATIKN